MGGQADLDQRKPQVIQKLAASLSAMAIVVSGTPSFAEECLVEEAAQAALERELELIRELAADPEDSFSGPDSCIAADIFNSFDLSTAIPDLAGFVATLPSQAIAAAINGAKEKACRAIEDTVSDSIGGAQDRLNIFDSTLSEELSGILDNGWDDLEL